MGIKFTNSRNAGNRRTWKHLGASLIVLGFLGGCSSVPDAANPVERYRGAVDLITDDEMDEATGGQAEGEEAVPGESEEFPSLASVPERPSVGQGDNVADGLIADPDKPDYATAIARQTNDDGTDVVATDSGDLQPAPPAQPAIAIEAQAVDLPPVEPAVPGTSSATTVPAARPSSGSQLNSTAHAATVPSQGTTSASGFLQIDSAGGQPLLSPDSVKVATIHFTNGSSDLDETDRRVLQKVVALLQQQGGVIRVIGHASSSTRATDPVRHKMVNYSVSVARADHIARELVRLGAARSRIMIGAVSDSQPLYFEVTPSGEAENRRAEIYIDS